METNLIAIETICNSHEIELSIIYNMHDIGLIELISVENIFFIKEEQLSDLEKAIRLNKNFSLNGDGISTIFQLLDKINVLQVENMFLKNRLKIYEEE